MYINAFTIHIERDDHWCGTRKMRINTHIAIQRNVNMSNRVECDKKLQLRIHKQLRRTNKGFFFYAKSSKKI